MLFKKLFFCEKSFYLKEKYVFQKKILKTAFFEIKLLFETKKIHKKFFHL